MALQRSVLLGALLLIVPFVTVLPFSGLISLGTRSLVTTNQKTITYNQTSEETYFASTSGLTTGQSPLNLAPRGIGFVAPVGKCAHFSVPVTVTSGTTLNLAMTSTNPANFYLLPTYTIQASPDGCGISGDPILSETNFTAYQLHWTAPENNTYYLIFTGPSTIIILMNDGSTKPVQEMANITYASTTETISWAASSTITNTYTTTTAVTPNFYVDNASTHTMAIEVAILILTFTIPIIGIVIHRRRN